jgi:tRNA-modifying protein YgfZ
MAEVPLFRLPRDLLLVRGPERRTWLDGLLTCGVTSVAPGSAGYGLLLTKQGKIVTDVFLVESGLALYLGVAPGHGASVKQLLERYLVMEDAELDSAPSELGFVAGSGPLPDGIEAGGTVRLNGLELHVAVTSAAAGGDTRELTALLASHGIGMFGVDFGERDNPHEASLDRVAVSWTKGCYLGQEVVCMQDMRGKVKRRLVALEGGVELLDVTGGEADVLAADGSVLGQVSSVHRAPGGAKLLASLSAPALESPGALSVSGAPVRVVESAAGKVS